MTSKGFYVLLAGGVGAAKFMEGMANVVNPELLKIIVNTGDDIELFGLNICPDMDIIAYTLSGLIDQQKGWGFKEESFNCLSEFSSSLSASSLAFVTSSYETLLSLSP